MEDSGVDEAEARLATRIIDGMGDGVYVLDGGTRCTYVNASLADLSGYDVETLQGASLATLHPAADIAQIETTIRDIAAPGGSDVETVATTLETASGDSIPVEVKLSPLPAGTDTPERVIGVVRNVTERRKLERYETLLQVMPDTVVVTDLEGVIVDIHGFEGWSGYEYDDLVGSHMSKTMPADDVEKAESIVAELILDPDSAAATFEQQIETKAGDLIPFENHITVIESKDGDEVTGTMSVLRNITDRRERERELERQNERLEEFANVVSHDLRNPLNVAMGRVELLRETGEPEHIDEIRDALERIHAIVEDVLTLAREGEAVEDPAEVSLATIATDAWSTVQHDGATLQVDDDPAVRADDARLQRLLENLFRNAIEHGGSDVSVRVGVFEPDPGSSSRLGMYVEDDGPGIPADEREAVFESGYTSVQDGTGFGLSIVQRIAEAHGWDVTVTEGRDGGARFEFTGVVPA